jgi:hypothetical protein
MVFQNPPPLCAPSARLGFDLDEEVQLSTIGSENFFERRDQREFFAKVAEAHFRQSGVLAEGSLSGSVVMDHRHIVLGPANVEFNSPCAGLFRVLERLHRVFDRSCLAGASVSDDLETIQSFDGRAWLRNQGHAEIDALKDEIFGLIDNRHELIDASTALVWQFANQQERKSKRLINVTSLSQFDSDHKDAESPSMHCQSDYQLALVTPGI